MNPCGLASVCSMFGLLDARPHLAEKTRHFGSQKEAKTRPGASKTRSRNLAEKWHLQKSILGQKPLKMTPPKLFRGLPFSPLFSWPKNGRQNDAKKEPKWSPNGAQMEPKWSQNGPNMEPKWTKNDLPIQNHVFHRTWEPFGPHLGPKWSQNGAKMEPKLIQNLSLEQKRSFFQNHRLEADFFFCS